MQNGQFTVFTHTHSQMFTDCEWVKRVFAAALQWAHYQVFHAIHFEQEVRSELISFPFVRYQKIGSTCCSLKAPKRPVLPGAMLFPTIKIKNPHGVMLRHLQLGLGLPKCLLITWPWVPVHEAGLSQFGNPYPSPLFVERFSSSLNHPTCQINLLLNKRSEAEEV